MNDSLPIEIGPTGANRWYSLKDFRRLTDANIQVERHFISSDPTWITLDIPYGYVADYDLDQFIDAVIAAGLRVRVGSRIYSAEKGE